jgi:hypothetical protein
MLTGLSYLETPCTDNRRMLLCFRENSLDPVYNSGFVLGLCL